MDARALILAADRIARKQGLNQTAWSRKAGRAQSGQTISRIVSKGDCRLSTFLAVLEPLGYGIRIVRIADKKSGGGNSS